ncbi:MAG TPA: tail fiber protein, partial [Candidatus Angelobacter sp.]|nr:tail fiber protein [Candidatus Angelobacter sp.]
MKQTTSGYTLVEILVVITVIGILTAISFMSFSSIQSDSRDSQRFSKAIVITEALEKYYDQNGEYPSCAAMTQSSEKVATDVLPGIDPSVLVAPGAPSGTNSISCVNLVGGADGFVYVGDGSVACSTNIACTTFTFVYKDEASSGFKDIKSRRSSALAANLTATATSNSTIDLLWADISAVNYVVERSSSPDFASPTLITTQPGTTFTSGSLTGGTTYYYRVKAIYASSESNWSVAANATTLAYTCADTGQYGTYPDCYGYDSLPIATSISGYWSTAPSGYLVEDGSAVSRATYADLYAALGGVSSPYGQGD